MVEIHREKMKMATSVRIRVLKMLSFEGDYLGTAYGVFPLYAILPREGNKMQHNKMMLLPGFEENNFVQAILRCNGLCLSLL